jgi:hypothetical protein
VLFFQETSLLSFTPPLSFSREKRGDRPTRTDREHDSKEQIAAEAEPATEEPAANAEAEAEAAPVEEGPKQLSLEEYRRQQQERRAQASLPAPRKAGEGEDLSKWGKAQVLAASKAEEEDNTEDATVSICMC